MAVMLSGMAFTILIYSIWLQKADTGGHFGPSDWDCLRLYLGLEIQTTDNSLLKVLLANVDKERDK